jgi:uncharacterized protein YceK
MIFLWNLLVESGIIYNICSDLYGLPAQILEVFTVKKVLIPLFIIIILLAGCSESNKQTSSNPKVNKNSNVYFSVSGNHAEIDGDKLLIDLGSSLQLIDVKTRKVMKELSTSDKFGIIGFDFSGDIIVWSDLRNDPRDVSK